MKFVFYTRKRYKFGTWKLVDGKALFQNFKKIGKKKTTLNHTFTVDSCLIRL